MLIVAISSSVLAVIFGLALALTMIRAPRKKSDGPNGNGNGNSESRSLKSVQVLADQAANSPFPEPLRVFATGYAHDVSNFISVVLLNTENLLSHIQSERSREFLHQISHACESAKFLNQQVLALGGHQVVEPVITNLEELINGNRPRFEFLIDHQNWLVVRVDKELEADVDPELILVALDCLIKNASDACQGNEILVQARRANDPAGSTLDSGSNSRADDDKSVMLHPDMIFIEVIHDGELDRSMNPDEMILPYFTSKPRNRGLGLTIVASIAANHGGRFHIRCERNQDKNAKVIATMFLPVHQEPLFAQSNRS